MSETKETVPDTPLPIPGRPAPSNAFLKPFGRPSDYSPEIAHEICERIAGGMGLVEIGNCDDMPSERTIHRWLNAHEDFRQRYTDARERQADHYLDEIRLIADDGRNDWMQRQRRDGSTEVVLDREHVERSKLRVSATQWVMAKLAPKKYGDKLQHEHSGSINVELDLRIDSAIKRLEAKTIDVTPLPQVPDKSPGDAG